MQHLQNVQLLQKIFFLCLRDAIQLALSIVTECFEVVNCNDTVKILFLSDSFQDFS